MVSLQGLKKLLEEVSGPVPQSLEMYLESQKMVKTLLLFNNIYKKANFIESSELEELWGNILSLAYSIEAKLKIRAYSGKPIQKTDENLKVALSFRSQNALRRRLVPLDK